MNERAAPFTLSATLALALTGCHAGVGPVVAYRFGDDARIGWEASGGFAVLRGSVGQTFSYGSSPNTPFYIAAEPGVLLGATLGADWATGQGVGFMPGAWLAGPVYPWDDTDTRYDIEDMEPFVTLAIGYRYAHGHEIYISPKGYLVQRVRFH